VIRRGDTIVVIGAEDHPHHWDQVPA
jgi:K+/H+ antiporter YhaU regulatory subunit KhtT